MNDSTFQLIGQTLKTTNRLSLLRAQTKLFCPECKALQPILDYFPNRTALLFCSHRRHVFDPATVCAFAKEKASRPKGKLISKGSSSGQLEVIRELPEEESAA